MIVELKRPPLSVFDAIAPGQSNRFRFRLSPDVFIAVGARVKAPGEGKEIAQAEVWWADLPEPAGSGPGLRRPVIVVQGDALNRSRIASVVCIPLTSNLKWADAPGNVRLPRKHDRPREGVGRQRAADPHLGQVAAHQAYGKAAQIEARIAPVGD